METSMLPLRKDASIVSEAKQKLQILRTHQQNLRTYAEHLGIPLNKNGSPHNFDKEVFSSERASPHRQSSTSIGSKERPSALSSVGRLHDSDLSINDSQRSLPTSTTYVDVNNSQNNKSIKILGKYVTLGKGNEDVMHPSVKNSKRGNLRTSKKFIDNPNAAQRIVSAGRKTLLCASLQSHSSSAFPDTLDNTYRECASRKNVKKKTTSNIHPKSKIGPALSVSGVQIPLPTKKPPMYLRTKSGELTDRRKHQPMVRKAAYSLRRRAPKQHFSPSNFNKERSVSSEIPNKTASYRAAENAASDRASSEIRTAPFWQYRRNRCSDPSGPYSHPSNPSPLIEEEAYASSSSSSKSSIQRTHRIVDEVYKRLKWELANVAKERAKKYKSSYSKPFRASPPSEEKSLLEKLADGNSHRNNLSEKKGLSQNKRVYRKKTRSVASLTSDEASEISSFRCKTLGRRSVSMKAPAALLQQELSYPIKSINRLSVPKEARRHASSRKAINGYPHRSTIGKEALKYRLPLILAGNKHTNHEKKYRRNRFETLVKKVSADSPEQTSSSSADDDALLVGSGADFKRTNRHKVASSPSLITKWLNYSNVELELDEDTRSSPYLREKPQLYKALRKAQYPYSTSHFNLIDSEASHDEGVLSADSVASLSKDSSDDLDQNDFLRANPEDVIKNVKERLGFSSPHKIDLPTEMLSHRDPAVSETAGVLEKQIETSFFREAEADELDKEADFKFLFKETPGHMDAAATALALSDKRGETWPASTMKKEPTTAHNVNEITPLYKRSIHSLLSSFRLKDLGGFKSPAKKAFSLVESAHIESNSASVLHAAAAIPSDNCKFRLHHSLKNAQNKLYDSTSTNMSVLKASSPNFESSRAAEKSAAENEAKITSTESDTYSAVCEYWHPSRRFPMQTQEPALSDATYELVAAVTRDSNVLRRRNEAADAHTSLARSDVAQTFLSGIHPIASGQDESKISHAVERNTILCKFLKHPSLKTACTVKNLYFESTSGMGGSSGACVNREKVKGFPDSTLLPLFSDTYPILSPSTLFESFVEIPVSHRSSRVVSINKEDVSLNYSSTVEDELRLYKETCLENSNSTFSNYLLSLEKS